MDTTDKLVRRLLDAIDLRDKDYLELFDSITARLRAGESLCEAAKSIAFIIDDMIDGTTQWSVINFKELQKAIANYEGK